MNHLLPRQMSPADRSVRRVSLGARTRLALGLAWVWIFLMFAQCGTAGDAPALTEYQIKALCLVNFAKYVDWPADAFTETNSPITIGVIGQSKFADYLKQAVSGKKISGRPILVQEIAAASDSTRCQLLFVSASEKDRLPEILEPLKTSPVLTVGETEPFIQAGGMINFMKREGKIRFDIDLNAARAARLRISSKLLNLADKVSGKL